MIDEELRKVQLVQLEIAKEIKRICDENEIKYFIDGGTLLGAVRHQGFIPWDDDLDIGMLRADYEKFLKIAPQKLDEKYFLQTWHQKDGYGLAFAKVQKRNTVFLEKLAASVKTQHGIFVDIFPYDNYPDNKEDQKQQGMRITITKKLMTAKCKYRPWDAENHFDLKKYIGYIPLRILALFFKKEKMVQFYEKNATAFNKIETDMLFAQAIEPYGEFAIPKECVDQLVELKFEDTTFKAMSMYDKYLTLFYGDYMTPPPEGKRENRHGIVKIDFGDV